MYKRIKLLGKLGQKFGREWKLDIDSPAEAIRGIATNRPEMVDYIRDSSEYGVIYHVLTPDRVFDEATIHSEFAHNTLIVSPQIQGAGALGKGLLGVTLLASSFFIPGAIGVLGLTINSTTVGLLGAALIGQGISQALSSSPETPDSDQKKKESFLFQNAQEVTQEGRPVPLVYGEFAVKSPIVISSSIDTSEY
jgi:predicted phage tail protein